MSSPRRIIDCRAERDPLACLRELDGAAIWREVEPLIAGSTRLELSRAPLLAIWTIPPGGAELCAVVAHVQPECLYLFAADAGMDSLEPFVKRLAALVKYAINNRGGAVTLAELAAATAQREITVRAGLDWLAARGQIAYMHDGGALSLATVSTGRATAGADATTTHLVALLRESAAYRAYYRRADPVKLITG